MGFFDGPLVTDAQRELVEKMDARTREWYLEAEIAMLNMRVSELEKVNENQRVAINELRLVNSFEDVAWKAKDERIAELDADLHKQADMNGRLLTENAELRQRIAELESAQLAQDKLILEYCSRITELEFALQPFAEQAEFIADDNGSLLNGLCSPAMSKKDFFAARKVLGEKDSA